MDHEISVRERQAKPKAWRRLLHCDPPVPPKTVLRSVWQMDDGSAWIDQIGIKAWAVSASVQLLVLVGKTAALFNGTYDPTDELRSFLIDSCVVCVLCFWI